MSEWLTLHLMRRRQPRQAHEPLRFAVLWMIAVLVIAAAILIPAKLADNRLAKACARTGGEWVTLLHSHERLCIHR